MRGSAEKSQRLYGGRSDLLHDLEDFRKFTLADEFDVGKTIDKRSIHLSRAVTMSWSDSAAILEK